MANIHDTKQISLRISPELWARLSAACEIRDLTISQVIRHKVTAFVEATEAEQKKRKGRQT